MKKSIVDNYSVVATRDGIEDGLLEKYFPPNKIFLEPKCLSAKPSKSDTLMSYYAS